MSLIPSGCVCNYSQEVLHSSKPLYLKYITVVFPLEEEIEKQRTTPKSGLRNVSVAEAELGGAEGGVGKVWWVQARSENSLWGGEERRASGDGGIDTHPVLGFLSPQGA